MVTVIQRSTMVEVLSLMKLVNISGCELSVNDHLAIAITIPIMIADRIEQVQLYINCKEEG